MIRVEHGDCLEVMRRLVDEGVRVDAVVTDPPYDLTAGKRGGSGATSLDEQSPAGRARIGTGGGFMGKAWDATGIAFRPEAWALVAETMKPGAHLVAFGAPRTHHRMWCAIEDAGFEIRDGIFDLVSTDSLAADFVASLSGDQLAALDRCAVAASFGGLLAWVYGQGFPKSLDVSKAIDKAAGAERPVVGVRPGHEDFVDRTDRYAAGARREGWNRPWKDDPDKVRAHHLRTAPSTDDARRWDGWGTALKPAIEPIVLARKPLDGSVVENALAHGTGALNVDRCRVSTEENLNGGAYASVGGRRSLQGDARIGAAQGMFQPGKSAGPEFVQPQGRWPANLVTDGSEEVLAAFPESDGMRAPVRGTEASRTGDNGIYRPFDRIASAPPRGDSGSAARFFYSAKASAADRAGSRHPTVKPIDLVAWLVRLVTPGGGLVLDPFAGSGTTGVAALRERCHAILIEREAAYVADINARFAALRGEGAHSLQPRRRDAASASSDAPGPLFGGAGR